MADSARRASRSAPFSAAASDRAFCHRRAPGLAPWNVVYGAGVTAAALAAAVMLAP